MKVSKPLPRDVLQDSLRDLGFDSATHDIWFPGSVGYVLAADERRPELTRVRAPAAVINATEAAVRARRAYERRCYNAAVAHGKAILEIRRAHLRTL